MESWCHFQKYEGRLVEPFSGKRKAAHSRCLHMEASSCSWRKPGQRSGLPKVHLPASFSLLSLPESDLLSVSALRIVTCHGAQGSGGSPEERAMLTVAAETQETATLLQGHMIWSLGENRDLQERSFLLGDLWVGRTQMVGS